ncbi:MAG: ROK family transcriptional regulator [Mycobacteriales bacterium]
MTARRLDPSQARVVQQLRLHGPLARAEIVGRSGLSRPTVGSALDALPAQGLVVELPGRDPRRRSAAVGRAPAVLALDRRAGVAAGVDIGKRHVRVGISDLAHVVVAERDLVVEPDLPAAEAVDLAAGLLDDVLAEAGLSRAAVVGVGVALPGPLHSPTGLLGSSTILPGWAGVPAADLVGRRLGLPVRLDNDANLGALAERIWGAGRDCQDFAYLKLATGIGCGLVLRGELYRGAGGTAGELGHVVTDVNGPVCRCGNRGCLETIAGTEPVLALLRPTLGDLTLAEVVARAVDGDATCRRVVADTGAAVGGAVATLVNLFNPARIVVGGALAATGPVLLDALAGTLARAAVPSALSDVTVVRAELDERAELYGAIALVLGDTTLELPLPA